MSWFDEEETEYKDLDAGIYEATLTNVSLDETKEVPRLSIEFTLAGKRKAWMNLGFAENQKKFANWQFRELGVYDDAKRIASDGTKSVPRAFLEAVVLAVGNQYKVDLSYRDYNGKKYSSVKVLEQVVKIGPDNDPVVKKSLIDLDEPLFFDPNETLPF